MDNKQIITVAATALITALVTGAVGWLIATSSAGQDAAERARIEAIVKEMLVTDTGTTHAAAIAQIDKSVAVISTKVDGIDNEVQLIREAVKVLSE